MGRQYASKVDVSLAFTADTERARRQLKELQDSLHQLSNTPITTAPLNKLNDDLFDATNAVNQLGVSLSQAINQDTGKLDLSKFNESLKKSGMSLEDYQNKLLLLGPSGERAFAELVQSITLAEVPLRRTSKLVNDMWKTLGNTFRWQISSSVLHSFSGVIQSAYGYAQDLNDSLNNIRIVTGQSADQMADFAKEANKAAKALSTTTTEYTKASLIYYQQGLNDKEVKDRTDVTVKMANVARSSAEDVSDQLTAVWNNFYDGTKSLEYYADVMTALGAATASSTEEISVGLNKFAAIAESVGLSYEYAASALATVTATTRQSADIVGTAFKTLFARMQDLELGQTLDDGTTLGKYSQALAAVGVDIKTVNGEMKDMDLVLEELAGKWDNLASAEKVALAQTVAGTRQYTQLIALMDNWDFMKQNLATSKSSEGTLDRQAEIYAESWEAASKRVKASAEDVYASIINDEFFIELTDTFADLLEGLDAFVDGLGGLKGILLTIGSLVTSIFANKISTSIQNAAYSIKMSMPGARDKELETKKQAHKTLIQGYEDVDTTSGRVNAEVYDNLSKVQLTYLDKVEDMDELERDINLRLLDREKILARIASQNGEELEQKEKEAKRLKNKLINIVDPKGSTEFKNNLNIYTNDSNNAAFFARKSLALDDINQVGTDERKKIYIQEVKEEIYKRAGITEKTETEEDKAGKLKTAFGKKGTKADDFKKYISTLEKKDLSIDKLQNLITELEQLQNERLKENEKNLKGYITGSSKKVKKNPEKQQQIQEGFDEYTAGLESVQEAAQNTENAVLKTNIATDKHGESLEKIKSKPLAFSEALSRATGAVMALGQVVTSIIGIIDVFNDENATTKDKIIAVVGAVSMLIPTIMATIPAFTSASVAAGGLSLAMWPITVAIIALTGAIVGIIALVDAAKRKSPEGQLKRAKEEAAKLAEQLEEVKDQSQKIKSIFESYDDVVNRLEDCVKGTQEWKDTLAEVNNVVLDLMTQYPELLEMADLFERDPETGMLTINEDKRKEVLDSYKQRELNVQAQTLYKNIEVKKREVQNNFIRDTDKYNVFTLYDDEVSVANSNKKALKITDFINTDTFTSYLGLDEKGIKEKIKKAVIDELGTSSWYAEEATSDNSYERNLISAEEAGEKFANSLNNIFPIVNSFAEEMVQVTNSIRNANQLIVDSILGDTASADEKAIFANYLEAEKTKSQDAKKKEAEVGDKSTGNRDKLNEQMKRYAEINNIDYQELAQNAIVYRNGKAYIKFKTVNDGKQKISVEDFYESLALDEIQNSKDTLLTQYRESLSKLRAAAGKNESEGVSQLLANQNFEGYSEEWINNLKGQDIASKLVEDSLFGSIREYAQAIGINTINEDGSQVEDTELIKQIEALVNDAKTAYESVSNILSNTVASAFNDFKQTSFDVISQFNVSQQTQLAEMMQSAFNVAGSDGLSLITNFFEDLNFAEMEKFLGTSFDWASMSAEDLKAKFMELGITISEDTETSLSDLIKIFKNQLNPSLKEIQNQVSKQKEVADDLKAIGDSISEDQFKALGEQYRDYFQLMADGNYKLIKSAELLNKELNNVYKMQLETSISNYSKEATLLSNVAQNKHLGISTSTRAQGEVIAALNLFNDNFTMEDLAELRNGTLQDGEALKELESIFSTITEDQLLLGSELAQTNKNNAIESLGGISTVKDLQGYVSSGLLSTTDDSYNRAVKGLMGTVTSIEELDQITRSSGIRDILIQADALIQLGSAYDSCALEVENLVTALENGDEKAQKAAIGALQTAINLENGLKQINYSDIFDINRVYDEELKQIEESIKDLTHTAENEIGSTAIAAYDVLADKLVDKSAILSNKITTNQKELDAIGSQLMDRANYSIGGVSLNIDSNGNINNYDEYMRNLVDRMNELQEEVKTDSTNVMAKDELATLNNLKEYLDGIIPKYDSLKDSIDSTNDSLEETNREQLQNTINKFSKANEDFETYIGTLDEYKNLLELTNLDDDETIIKTLKDIQDVRKQSLDAAIEGFNQIRAAGNATDEEIQQAQQAALDAAKEYAAALKATVLEEIEGLGKELEKELTGGMRFDDVATSLERAQSLQEEYLTDTNKIYEVNKLINEAQKQVDATTNDVAKQKLKNFIEQTKELEKQNKLSKFELDIRQAEYDVMLAEIALQEAQQAKSTVRLRRDSEGNFGYVYTADENKVADAEQKLADAQNALYNVGLEGANNYTQKQFEVLQNAKDQLDQLNEAWMNGEIENMDEYNRKVAEIEAYTVQQYQTYGDLLVKATAADTKIISESWASALELELVGVNQLEIKLNDYVTASRKYIEDYNTSLGELTTTDENSPLSILARATTDATTAAKELSTALSGGEEGSGATEDMNNFNETAKITADEGAADYTKEVEDSAKKTNELATALTGDNGEGGLNGAMTAIDSSVDATKTSFAELVAIIQQTVEKVQALQERLEALSSKDFTVNYTVAQEEVVAEGEASSNINKGLKPLKNTGDKQAILFDTGGYTGSWGPEGRYAVLHEKELILNQEDTANILASVELLRGIIDTLDLQTASSMLGGMLVSPGHGVGSTSTTVDQNVKIEATFPNVQDHNEIEEAFNNLINQASQYANRK